MIFSTCYKFSDFLLVCVSTEYNDNICIKNIWNSVKTYNTLLKSVHLIEIISEWHTMEKVAWFITSNLKMRFSSNELTFLVTFCPQTHLSSKRVVNNERIMPHLATCPCYFVNYVGEYHILVIWGHANFFPLRILS